MRVHSKQVCMATASGFTIIELVVSIGILGILMVVAGSVFALTLKSSGQATALIDIHQSLRALEDSLREDLAGVSPNAAIMVIQSHAINSYWTAEAKEIDDNANPLDTALSRDPQREKVVGANVEVEPPRADMLMFFTSRTGTSFRDPEVSGTLQQVVYGHALPGEWSATTKQWAPSLTAASGGFVDQFDESSFAPSELMYVVGPPNYQYDLVPMASAPPVFAIPARDWHLARRGVLIVDQNYAGANPPKLPAMGLDDAVAALNVPENDPEYPQLQQEFYIRDGRRDFVIDQTGFDFENDVVKMAPFPSYDEDDANATSLMHWMPRTRLDYSPPSNQIDRMGQYFLPHCASFKVEWALNMADVLDYFYGDEFYECRNDPGEDAPGKFPWGTDLFWVDPGSFAETIEKINDVRIQMINESSDSGACHPAIDSLIEKLLSNLVPQDPTQTDYTSPCSRANYETNRFLLTNDGSVNSLAKAHVFYPTKPYASFVGEPLNTVQTSTDDCISGIPDPLFPKALRITVDIYDPSGRLERPIRHVMILPVGE